MDEILGLRDERSAADLQLHSIHDDDKKLNFKSWSKSCVVSA